MTGNPDFPARRPGREKGQEGGERDLDRLLRGLRPALDPERYHFTTARDEADLAARLPSALMLFREAEATTLILPVTAADDARGQDAERAPPSPIFRRITLTVHSSLEAVGLTAAITRALTDAGISANIVAASYHDHLFVPDAQADAALRVLRRLSARSD